MKFILLLFCSFLLIPFQNCSVYESDGRKEYASSLVQAENRGCYPYIDTNIAMEYLGITGSSLNVYKTFISGESAVSCDFRATGILLNHINCKVSFGSSEQLLLLQLYNLAAFEDTVDIWTAGAGGIVLGLVGSNHGGYITLNSDGSYTLKYLALDGDESKAVGCAVRLAASDYLIPANITSAKNTVSKMAYEMAINNME